MTDAMDGEKKCKHIDSGNGSWFERGQELRQCIKCGGRYFFGLSPEEQIKELRTRVAELTKHEEQTHKELGDILGTDDSLKNCALRLQNRLSTLEKEKDQFGQDILKETGLCFFSDGKIDLDGLSTVILNQLSTLEKDVETWKIVAKGEENMRLEDEAKLSTLLKASEGMEKAIKAGHRYCMDKESFKLMESALADFRAVKEGK